ncbi:ATP-binding protein [Pedobacter sp. AW1-32]|uniref:ATP-binding protein n=1 Tax=Pedobacter sp. AW1-32 TaxID=3383026 RepID=UPI003FF12469
MISTQGGSTEQFLSGGGEMGKLIRSMDWSKTALGPIESWPQSLRTSVSLCLSSTFPILIAWGPETIQIYNDSYRPICGAMHPQSMGMNFRVCWESALEVVGDKFTRGQQGEGTYIQDQQMFLQRYGYLEEAFMTFSFAPIRDESGGVGGIFHPITETTDKMLSARRTQVLRDLGACINKAKSIEEIVRETEGKYAEFLYDLPFALFYQYNAASNTANLLSASGISKAAQLACDQVSCDEGNSLWPFNRALQNAEHVVIDNLQNLFGEFSCEPYPETPHTAVLMAIYISGQEQPFGFLVAGVSARRALDDTYMGFYDLLANTYNTAVSNVFAYEQEQKRAEALAEIDRSKTAFFSNVSHEFRTPLTLMLGPLEDLLSGQKLTEEIKAPVEATHRNALRLLKLVNNLLDYSRVEAGRTQAAYQPLDLAELSKDLASSFRSMIERAGMQLIVDCENMNGATYIDRQMWEKIVLNLLSNAFKYTLEGTITLSLKQDGNFAVLRVSDTGVGIPAKELPHMFQRFHRVENTAGRTHEGTGIGLSLVHELVSLHGGEIMVDSIEGKGSVFTIRVPLGKSHLPDLQVIETLKETDSAALKGAFIKEANSLLEDSLPDTGEDYIEQTDSLASELDFTPTKETRILIVDDNGDMREYLKRLLQPYFSVFTANNGAIALSKITEFDPHLVLSDIMMPVMDGKTMLQNIRTNPLTLRLPVVFLSARAGEEARIDGLEAGADDYLVKPFSAAELLTKVRAQIKISMARGHAEQELRSLLTDAPVAIAIYSGPTHIVSMANERMLQYWGLPAQEVFDKPLFDVIPDLKEQGFQEMMNKVFKTGNRFVSGEIPVKITRGGESEMSFIHLTVEARKNEKQQVIGMIAVAAEVTEAVMARRDLEKATDTLKLAMEAANLGTWRTDWGSGNLIVSDIARKIHGIPLEQELTFDGTLDVVVPEHREAFHRSILETVDTKKPFSLDYMIQPWDGSKLKWLNSTGKVELNENGEVIGVIGTILDITESKEDNQRKDDFIAMVSHELKTPLTSLKGYTQILHRHASNHDDQFSIEKLNKMISQVEKMGAMIGGFLNVSRLESGKIQLNKQTFELSALLEEMIHDAENSTHSHNIVLQPTDVIMVHADRDKIGNVILNLISNAIKYSPTGTLIHVSSFVEAAFAVVRIADEGMGIRPEDRDKLFDRYYRVDNPHTLNISGFGIGLYLSAEIVRRHDGHIGVDSDGTLGSVFHFKIPLQ